MKIASRLLAGCAIVLAASGHAVDGNQDTDGAEIHLNWKGLGICNPTRHQRTEREAHLEIFACVDERNIVQLDLMKARPGYHIVIMDERPTNWRIFQVMKYRAVGGGTAESQLGTIDYSRVMLEDGSPCMYFFFQWNVKDAEAAWPPLTRDKLVELPNRSLNGYLCKQGSIVISDQELAEFFSGINIQ